jgi:hypothetical protein
MRIRMAVALAVVLGCLFSAIVQAEDAYLCVGEQATGFGFHGDNTWGVERFQPTKLIVKRTTDLIHKWQVYDFSKNVAILNCNGDFNENGLLECSGISEFRMSREKMRFLYIYTIGYWSETDKYPAYKEGTNTPWMEIGKCSPF